MTGVRVCTFEHRGVLMPGLMLGNRVVSLAQAYAAEHAVPPASLLELVGTLDKHLPALAAVASKFEQADRELLAASLPLSEVRLQAPLLYPGKIFCAGANYYDHVAGMVGAEKASVLFSPDLDPYFFMKGENTVCGTGHPVAIPKGCMKLDWEVELALVIGRKCRNVPVQEAAAYVAGYMVLIDLSARDLSRRPAGYVFPNDFVAGKAFDHAAPMGPCILLKRPEEAFPEFRLRLFVNDQLKQNSSTAQMIIKPDRQVSWLSQRITLNPGDVIATGTPAGAGFETGHFLKAGDVIRAEIDGIGTLVTSIVAQ